MNMFHLLQFMNMFLLLQISAVVVGLPYKIILRPLSDNL